ncbi:unnamed protein product, partial [marine sediment metagenome]
YIIMRGMLFFDTSSIPSGSNIINAVLSIKIESDYSEEDFDITIRNGQPTYPHFPLEVGDYLYSHYSGDGGSTNTYGLATDVYTDIKLNSTGCAWIEMGDSALTKLALISSRDISESPPEDPNFDEYVAVNSGDAETYKPKLTILYSLPADINVIPLLPNIGHSQVYWFW